jgi:predicted enzyme related to lactoylglutathione lyase
MILKLKLLAMSFVLTLVLSHNAIAQQTISVIIPPMNNPPTGLQLPGKIIWHDLFTRDTFNAREFYTNLFGWSYQTYSTGGKTYTLFSYKGKSIAGMVELEPGNENENQWISYLSVLDVNLAAGHVTTNGGKVLLSPRMLHQLGELAIFTDPDGAAFGILSSMSGDPEDFLVQANEWVWADLLVKRPLEITRFYQGIANYEVVDDTRSAEPDDYILRTSGFARAGVGPLPASDVLPNWLPYVRVANITNSVTKVMQLGGTVIMQPDVAVFGGKLSVVADPTGAVFGIVQINQ